MQLVEATNEKGVVRTSSPARIPAARRAQWRPAVPEETPTAWEREARAAQRFSKSSILGPMERVGVVRTSTTASISRWVMSGWERGIDVGMILSAVLGRA